MQRSLRRFAFFGCLLSALALTSSCKDDRAAGPTNSSGASNGGTAVVDLDKAFRELGWTIKLQGNQETYASQLKTDYQQFQKGYDAQLQQHMKDMVPPGTKEGEKYTLSQVQSQELANYVYAARQQVQALGQEAQQFYNNYRTQWVRQYRDALSPIVREVAQDKRMNVVMMSSESILFADRTVDLTDAVVDAARKQPPTLTEVPMQHLQGSSDVHPQQTAPSLTQPSSQPAMAPATQP
jgi:Skp family chaperone for outer membrane proteins